MKPLILAVAIVIAALVIFGANRLSLKPTITTTTVPETTTTQCPEPLQCPVPLIIGDPKPPGQCPVYVCPTTTTTQLVTATTLAITGSVVEQQALSELENELEQAVANITVEDVEQALTQ